MVNKDTTLILSLLALVLATLNDGLIAAMWWVLNMLLLIDYIGHVWTEWMMKSEHKRRPSDTDF